MKSVKNDKYGPAENSITKLWTCQKFNHKNCIIFLSAYFPNEILTTWLESVVVIKSVKARL